MTLPARMFWKLETLAMRWDCAVEDIVGWATDGIVEILTTIRMVQCDGRDWQVGLMVVCAEDLMPLFHRRGPEPRSCPIWRIRPPGEDAWKVITDPAQGLTIELGALMVAAKTAQRFEEEYDPLQRVHVSPGRTPRHDWEGMQQALMIRLFEQGLPESQAELVAEGQEWFIANTKDGSVPDESQIRRKLSPIWRALNKAR